MIDFYYAPTPNGWKVAVMLEECGFAYNTILMRLSEGDQFSPGFLAISPGGKIPAIVDHDTGGGPVSVFESGAILLYLAEKAGRFAPPDTSVVSSPARKELMEWLFWQVGNQGPMAGQLSHFVNYAPKGQEYGSARYKNEYKRCLMVLETRLLDRDYILGDYSIVDIIGFPWVFIAKPLGVDLSDYPRVSTWRAAIKTRPAVRRAIDLYKDKQNRGAHTAENNPLLFHQDGSQMKPDE
ncbi:MAG: Disulfide-bond oxidoreductase YfcG [Gammaproteobacteria bacterium]|nr:Disulfide-bond oxidoreductase YfcG [Gammaproteobacteria bacterium]